MQEELNIALIQSNLVWEKPKRNRKNFEDKIKNISNPVDIIILPEMFTTGFTMNASNVAETMEGKTITWMRKMAHDTKAAICGSLIIEETGHYYNRLLFAHPEGHIDHYDKRHTFSLAGEDKVFTAGNNKHVINYKGWKLMPMVCYDLRFPVWTRNVEDYDAIFFVANWPKPRIDAWDTLLKARAIENMSYCIGVNRVGEDKDQNEYSGHSAVYDVLGNILTRFKPSKEGIEIITLQKKHIHYYRNKLKFLEDRDLFTLM